MTNAAGKSGKGSRVSGTDRAELTEELTRRYADGASIRSLAAETGRSYGFVHGLLVDARVSLRGRGGATRRRSATT
jgi:Helix-turn-helix domain